jgi:hypothetical protein
MAPGFLPNTNERNEMTFKQKACTLLDAALQDQKSSFLACVNSFLV